LAAQIRPKLTVHGSSSSGGSAPTLPLGILGAPQTKSERERRFKNTGAAFTSAFRAKQK
jgi:hypothetical protein